MEDEECKLPFFAKEKWNFSDSCSTVKPLYNEGSQAGEVQVKKFEGFLWELGRSLYD